MAPSLGVETFHVLGLEVRDEVDESCSFFNTTHAQKDCYGASVTYEVMVTGTKGIHWREVVTQKVRRGFQHSGLFGKRLCVNWELCLLFCSPLRRRTTLT